MVIKIFHNYGVFFRISIFRRRNFRLMACFKLHRKYSDRESVVGVVIDFRIFAEYSSCEKSFLKMYFVSVFEDYSR